MFNPSEILEFALNIERNGEAFYRFAMEVSGENKKLRKIFHFLAVEEAKHERAFASMLSSISAASDAWDMGEEYFDYLRAFVDNVVFTDEKLAEIQEGIDTPLKAVQFGMQREQETILFYMELIQRLATEEDRATVQDIVAEERKHYLMLARLAEKMQEPTVN